MTASDFVAAESPPTAVPRASAPPRQALRRWGHRSILDPHVSVLSSITADMPLFSISPIPERGGRTCGLLQLAALVVLLATGTPSQAQGLSGPSADSTSAARITGFASLPWGATADEVVDRWGSPDTTHVVGSLSSTALVYPNEQVLGEAAAMGMLIHERRGLIRGQYLVRYGGGRDCERVYRKYRDAVGNVLSGLTPQEQKTAIAGDSAMGFCTAFELGNARAWSRWSDSATGAQATVRLDGGQGVVRVSYEASGFDTLTKRARAEARKARFGGADGGQGRPDSTAVDSLLQLLSDSTRADSAESGGG